MGPNCDGSECAHKAEIGVIVTLSSSEQSRFISYFLHHRSTGDPHVYVQKHPNSAPASTTDFLEASRARAELQSDSSRTDSPVRILHAQLGSAVSMRVRAGRNDRLDVPANWRCK